MICDYGDPILQRLYLHVPSISCFPTTVQIYHSNMIPLFAGTSTVHLRMRIVLSLTKMPDRSCRSSATLGVLAPLSTLAGRLRQALSRSSLSAECASAAAEGSFCLA